MLPYWSKSARSSTKLSGRNRQISLLLSSSYRFCTRLYFCGTWQSVTPHEGPSVYIFCLASNELPASLLKYTRSPSSCGFGGTDFDEGGSFGAAIMSAHVTASKAALAVLQQQPATGGPSAFAALAALQQVQLSFPNFCCSWLPLPVDVIWLQICLYRIVMPGDSCCNSTAHAALFVNHFDSNCDCCRKRKPCP